MENKQWHLDRLNGIGGSEAAIILGISPFKSRLELYYEKVEKKININNSNLLFDIGHALEPVIANYYSKETGRQLKIRKQKTHPKYSFITGNIDREITKSERDSPGILEIKTKGNFVDWYDDNIPIYYIVQLQQYLSVYNYSWGSFAILDLGSRKIKCIDIERNDNLIEVIIKENIKFWKLVQDKTPPEIEPTISCENFLKEHFKKSDPITIDISDNKYATLQAELLKNTNIKIKELDKLKLECKTFFMNLMKNAEKAIGNNYIITWKNDKDSSKFDIENFKLENPILYNKYLKPKKGVRRFLTKFKKS